MATMQQAVADEMSRYGIGDRIYKSDIASKLGLTLKQTQYCFSESIKRDEISRVREGKISYYVRHKKIEPASRDKAGIKINYQAIDKFCFGMA